MTIPYNEVNAAKMRRVAYNIMGTCKSLDDFLKEEFGDEDLSMTDFDVELLRELDDITQECQDCGWWCETSDLNEDQVCSDCAPEADEDD